MRPLLRTSTYSLGDIDSHRIQVVGQMFMLQATDDALAINTNDDALGKGTAWGVPIRLYGDVDDARVAQALRHAVELCHGSP